MTIILRQTGTLHLKARDSSDSFMVYYLEDPVFSRLLIVSHAVNPHLVDFTGK